MKQLERKVAVITGGSRGIGAAIAVRLAADGATVVVNYANAESEAAKVAARIESEGGRALAVKADVSRKAGVQHLFARAVEAFGGVDILVTSAGRTHMRPAPLAEASEDLFDEIFGLNTKGVFLCMQEGVKHLRAGGRVITLSTTGVVASHVGYGIYTASKSAVEVLTRVLARELRGKKITVNCIAPGATATDEWLRGKEEALLRTIAELSPLARLGTPEDIAALAGFLARPDAEWVNGQVIRANGGFA